MQLPYKQQLLTSSWLFRATKQHQAAHDQIEGETDTILLRLKVNYSNTEGNLPTASLTSLVSMIVMRTHTQIPL